VSQAPHQNHQASAGISTLNTPRFDLTVPPNAVDHSVGPHDARVTVVEYGDFECPNCKQARPAVKLMLDHHAGQVRFIFRHFPLEEVHPHAVNAAEAAESAGAQGKFWQMHDVLFENQARLKPNQLAGYAEKLELDVPRYTSEMSEHIYLQRIREHMQGGRDSGVRATPTFFINGRIHDVSFGIQSLLDGVQALLPR
jgi:protein-disulfide isomerase